MGNRVKFVAASALTSVLFAGCASRGLGTAHDEPANRLQTSANLHVANGSAWRVAGSKLRVIGNGDVWQSVALDSRIHVSDIAAVTQTRKAGLVVSTYKGSSLDVFVRPASGTPWRASALHLKWPRGLGDPDSRARIGTSTTSSGVITVTAVNRLTTAGAAEQSFVSTNGGATFSAQPSINGVVWDSALFLSADAGVVIEGPASNRVAYTGDAGVTWQMSKLDGIGDANSIVLTSLFEYPDGTIGVSGTQSGVAGTTLVTFASTDAGASFEPVASSGADVPPSDGQGALVMGNLGDDLWAVPSSGTSIWRSKDGGATWSQTQVSGLGADADAISVTSDDSAVVSTAVTTCTDKQACGTQDGSFMTADGGLTWQPATS